LLHHNAADFQLFKRIRYLKARAVDCIGLNYSLRKCVKVIYARIILYVLRPKSVGLACQFAIAGYDDAQILKQLVLSLVLFFTCLVLFYVL